MAIDLLKLTLEVCKLRGLTLGSAAYYKCLFTEAQNPKLKSMFKGAQKYCKARPDFNFDLCTAQKFLWDAMQAGIFPHTAKVRPPERATGYIPPPPRPGIEIRYGGDIDGDGYVSMEDAYYLTSHLAGKSRFPLTDAQKLKADVNGNGKINIADAMLIGQYALGKINKFPRTRFIAAPRKPTCVQPFRVVDKSARGAMPIGLRGVRVVVKHASGRIGRCTTGSDGRCKMLYPLSTGERYTLSLENIPRGYTWDKRPDNVRAGTREVLFALFQKPIGPIRPPPKKEQYNQGFAVLAEGNRGVRGVTVVAISPTGERHSCVGSGSVGMCRMMLTKGETYTLSLEQIPAKYKCVSCPTTVKVGIRRYVLFRLGLG